MQLLALQLLLVAAAWGNNAAPYGQRTIMTGSAPSAGLIDRHVLHGGADRLLNHTKQLWHALFGPRASSDNLLEFFRLQRLHRHERVISAYATSVIRRGIITLRQHLSLLEELFDVDSVVPYRALEFMLDTVVNKWGLSAGHALGIALRHCTALDVYDRPHRERAHAAFRFLVSTGARFTSGSKLSQDDLDTRSRQPRLLDCFDSDEEITRSVLTLIDDRFSDRDAVLCRIALQYEIRCDDNMLLMIALVEHGLGINDDNHETGVSCLSQAIVDHRLRDATVMLALGAEFEPEGITIESRRALPNNEVDNDAKELLKAMVTSAVQPAKVFAHFFEMFSLPVSSELVQLAGAYQTHFSTREWAHNILVHLLTGNYVDNIDSILPLIVPPNAVFQGVGRTILRDFQMCRPNALDDLKKLSAMTTRHALAEALQQTCDAGRTILHAPCMTLDIFDWIREHASLSWVIRALTTTVDGESCVDFWLARSSLNESLPLIYERARHLGHLDRAISLYDMVVEACSDETLAGFTDDEILQLYLSATAPYQSSIHRLLTSPPEGIPTLVSEMSPSVSQRLPHVLLMEIAAELVFPPGTEPGIVLETLCSVDNGSLLVVQWPSDGWTPLHRAVAHPSLHHLVPSLLRIAAASNRLLELLFAKDHNDDTFLSLAMKRLEIHSEMNSDAAAYDRLIDNTLNILTGNSEPSMAPLPIPANTESLSITELLFSRVPHNSNLTDLVDCYPLVGDVSYNPDSEDVDNGRPNNRSTPSADNAFHIGHDGSGPSKRKRSADDAEQSSRCVKPCM